MMDADDVVLQLVAVVEASDSTDNDDHLGTACVHQQPGGRWNNAGKDVTAVGFRAFSLAEVGEIVRFHVCHHRVRLWKGRSAPSGGSSQISSEPLSPFLPCRTP